MGFSSRLLGTVVQVKVEFRAAVAAAVGVRCVHHAPDHCLAQRQHYHQLTFVEIV